MLLSDLRVHPATLSPSFHWHVYAAGDHSAGCDANVCGDNDAPVACIDVALPAGAVVSRVGLYHLLRSDHNEAVPAFGGVPDAKGARC